MHGPGYGKVTVTAHGRFRVDVRGRYVGTFKTADEAEERRQEYAATLPPPRRPGGGPRPRPLRGHIKVRMCRDGARYTAMLRGKSLGVCWERKEAQALLDAALESACNHSEVTTQSSATPCASAGALSE